MAHLPFEKLLHLLVDLSLEHRLRVRYCVN